MDRFTHYLVVFCQIGAVLLGLTLVGAVIVWAFGFVAAISLGIVLMLLSGALLMLIHAAGRRA